jgi:phosphatidylserine decarboxylase
VEHPADPAADRAWGQATQLNAPRLPRWRPLTEGAPLLLGCAAVTALAARVYPPLALLGVAGTAAVAAAFRDPERTIEADPRVALAPADGRVLHVSTEHDDYWNADLLEVGIFLALWNVHVQRAPIEGTVVAQRRKPGGYKPAMTAAATHGNNQLATYIETAAGPCTVTQISGIAARRIVTWVEPGTHLQQGERLGMIKFGSQVTLRVPPTATLLVEVGQPVRAGITPLVRFEA